MGIRSMTPNLMSSIPSSKSQISIPADVHSAIKQASARTGMDFGYMLAQAAQESSFDPNAKAETSSATGLYQFIDQTWLDTVKKHGEAYGLGEAAAQIEPRSGGGWQVRSKEARDEILSLRTNPAIASSMAAEFAKDNREQLQSAGITNPDQTDLYLAHFLGARGAADFLNAKNSNSTEIAANVFPEAARANRGVFYDRQTGEARTLGEVYGFFDKKMTERQTEVAALTGETIGNNGDDIGSWNDSGRALASNAMNTDFAKFYGDIGEGTENASSEETITPSSNVQLAKNETQMGYYSQPISLQSTNLSPLALHVLLNLEQGLIG